MITSLQWVRLFDVAVPNGVTTLLVNLFVTNVQKVVQTVQLGQMKPTMTISPKATKEESLIPKEITILDGIEVEEIEFDDSSEVDYDLDYTVQY